MSESRRRERHRDGRERKIPAVQKSKSSKYKTKQSRAFSHGGWGKTRGCTEEGRLAVSSEEGSAGCLGAVHGVQCACVCS